jgi:hypothetical protein
MVAPNRTVSSWYHVNTCNNDRGVRRGNAHANTPKKMVMRPTQDRDKATQNTTLCVRVRKKDIDYTNSTRRHNTFRHTHVGRLCRTKNENKRSQCDHTRDRMLLGRGWVGGRRRALLEHSRRDNADNENGENPSLPEQYYYIK